MAQIVFEWIGIIVISVFVVALLLLAFGYACNEVKELYFAHARKMQLEGMKEVGLRMHDIAWWFSEDPPTMKLLQVIGQEVARSGAFNSVWNLREDWRKQREPKDEVADASGEN
jgi:hypothetical protein